MLHTFNLQTETTKWLLLHSLVYIIRLGEFNICDPLPLDSCIQG